jgi:site-specific DNA-methyltransferase (adenine-specific)
MKLIDDHSIDMILCDLPYSTTANPWDRPIPLEPLWQNYKRIIKKNGAIVLFAQIPFSITLGASNLSWLRYEWIFSKPMATGFLNCHIYPLKSHENILVFCEGLHTYNPQKSSGKPYTRQTSGRGKSSTNYRPLNRETATINNGDRYPRTILEFSHDPEKLHPTAKPVPLLSYLLATYTNPGELVLDNCVGSGSTAIAAIDTGRDFIGFELDPTYFAIAQKRIATHEIPHASTASLACVFDET